MLVKNRYRFFSRNAKEILTTENTTESQRGTDERGEARALRYEAPRPALPWQLSIEPISRRQTLDRLKGPSFWDALAKEALKKKLREAGVSFIDYLQEKRNHPAAPMEKHIEILVLRRRELEKKSLEEEKRRRAARRSPRF